VGPGQASLPDVVFEPRGRVFDVDEAAVHRRRLDPGRLSQIGVVPERTEPVEGRQPQRLGHEQAQHFADRLQVVRRIGRDTLADQQVQEPLYDRRGELFLDFDALADQLPGEEHAFVGALQEHPQDPADVVVLAAPQHEGEECEDALGAAEPAFDPLLQIREIGGDFARTGPGREEFGERVVPEPQVFLGRHEDAGAAQDGPEILAPPLREAGLPLGHPVARGVDQRRLGFQAVDSQVFDDVEAVLPQPVQQLQTRRVGPGRVAQLGERVTAAHSFVQEVRHEPLVEVDPAVGQRPVRLERVGDGGDGGLERVADQLAQPAVPDLPHELGGLPGRAERVLGPEPGTGELFELDGAERLDLDGIDASALEGQQFVVGQRAGRDDQPVVGAPPDAVGERGDHLSPGLWFDNLVEAVDEHEPAGAQCPAGQQFGSRLLVEHPPVHALQPGGQQLAPGRVLGQRPSRDAQGQHRFGDRGRTFAGAEPVVRDLLDVHVADGRLPAPGSPVIIRCPPRLSASVMVRVRSPGSPMERRSDSPARRSGSAARSAVWARIVCCT
jgi:hypothetical protein